jgi:hypothetical protein
MSMIFIICRWQTASPNESKIAYANMPCELAALQSPAVN